MSLEPCPARPPPAPARAGKPEKGLEEPGTGQDWPSAGRARGHLAIGLELQARDFHREVVKRFAKVTGNLRDLRDAGSFVRHVGEGTRFVGQTRVFNDLANSLTDTGRGTDRHKQCARNGQGLLPPRLMVSIQVPC